jgi:hypothetical protein
MIAGNRKKFSIFAHGYPQKSVQRAIMRIFLVLDHCMSPSPAIGQILQRFAIEGNGGKRICTLFQTVFWVHLKQELIVNIKQLTLHDANNESASPLGLVC